MKQTLESSILNAREEYAKRGHDEHSWQWLDEGLVYAIQDYLSSFDMTEHDWEYARNSGIDDLVGMIFDDAEEDAK